MSQTTEITIPIYFTKDYFKNVLECGLRQMDLEILELEIEKLKLGGENYCSNIYRATVSFTRIPTGDKYKNIFIIKSMPKDKQATLTALQIYLKETVFYLDIKKKLEILMWSATKKTWSIGAKHIYSATAPEETIIFEDLCQNGYKLQSRQTGLDLDHAKLTIKKMAEYHAATMVMAQKEPTTIIERYPFGLLNMATIKAPSFKELFGAQLLKLTEIIENKTGYKEIAENLRNFYKNFEEKLIKAVYPMEGAINVLNHGDIWVNNLFFKYDENKKPNDVEFIDFQLCYYGSPGFDIIYFLTTSLQLDILKNQRQILIEYYYEILIETLKLLRYNQILPSYEIINNEIQKRETYGIIVAIVFFPLMSMSHIESQDVSLETLQNADFVNRKLEFMFLSNPRTIEVIIYLLKRANEMKILN